MADDPNNKPVNGSNRPLNGNSKIEQIQRKRLDLAAYPDITEQQKLEAAIAREETKFQVLEDSYNKSTSSAARAILKTKMTARAQKHTQAEERLELYEQEHVRKTNASAAQEISTYTKYENIKARTITNASKQKYYNQIRQDEKNNGNLLQTPTEVIQNRIETNQRKAALLGKTLAGRTRGLGLDDWSDNMKADNNKIEELQESVSRDRRLLKMQNKEGMTTEKRQNSVRDIQNKAGSILDQEKLTKDVREGKKYGTLEQETEKLSTLFSKLSAASEHFEKTSQNATDAQGNLTKEYKDASKALDDLQKVTNKQTKVIGEIERQGGGTRGQRFASAATGFNRAANIAYAVDIDDEISEMRLKSAMGKRAVQQYDRSSAAIGGDMSALLREASGQQFVKQFSNKIKSREGRRAALTLSSGAENAFGKIIDNVSGVFSGKGGGRFKKGLSALKGAGSDVAVGVASTFRAASQLGRDIPQTIKTLEGGLAADDMAETALAIPARATQTFYDNYMNQSSATVGLGSKATNMQKQMTDINNITTMAELGISPAKSAQLAAQGVRQLGSAEDIPAMIQMAGRTEQSRLMSADQYMGMQGQLTDVGAGTFDLEGIMKNAVAAGMDNAKNIQQMVSATQQMASGLSKSGVSGVGAAGNILGVGVQKLRDLGVKKNIATQASQYAQESQKKFSKDISMDLGTVHEAKRIKEIAPGIDTTFQMRIASMSQAQMQSIISGGKKEAEAFGLGSVYDKVGKEGFKNFAIADREATLYKTDANIFLSSKEFKQNIKNIRSGKGPTNKAQALFSTLTDGSRLDAVTTAGMEAKEGKLPLSAGGNLERSKVTQGLRKAAEIKLAGGNNPDAKMDTLITIMEKIAENLKPEQAQANVIGGMKEMDEVGPIVQAGDKFDKGASLFASAVGEFDRMLSKVDLSKQKTGGLKLQGGSNRSKTGRK